MQYHCTIVFSIKMTNLRILFAKKVIFLPRYAINGAFLKTQRRKIILDFDINLLSFNPKFNPTLCFSNIKHKFVQRPPHIVKICVRTHPDTNLCIYCTHNYAKISLTQIFSSPPLLLNNKADSRQNAGRGGASTFRSRRITLILEEISLGDHQL